MDKTAVTIQRRVWCTFRVPGLHCWPSAPTDVYFLATPHRHVFHVRVEVEVNHEDRDVEFITLRNVAYREFLALGSMGEDGHKDFSTNSCEHLALMLHSALRNHATRPYDVRLIEVSEDGESGATLTFQPSGAKVRP